jgi:hypothetical protein
MRSLRTALLALAAVPLTLAAQIGHPPDKTPYQDVLTRHALTLVTGAYVGGDDPVGLLPRSGPLLGVRYDTHIGGPAQLTARVLLAPTDRRVIDPLRPDGQRDLGTTASTLTMGDIGINVNLTGSKSWRGLVPSVLVTVGLMSDFAPEDDSGYSFGTNFSFGVGGGLRYVPTDSRWEYRADVHRYLAQQAYPTSFFRVTEDGTSVLPQGAERSGWRGHTVLSLGLSYHLAR